MFKLNFPFFKKKSKPAGGDENKDPIINFKYEDKRYSTKLRLDFSIHTTKKHLEAYRDLLADAALDVEDLINKLYGKADGGNINDPADVKDHHGD